MKSYVCVSVYIIPRFRKPCHLLADYSLVSCIACSSALKMEAIPPKHGLTFNGLHGVVTQKIELFSNEMNCTINKVKLVHVSCYHFDNVGVSYLKDFM
jgi:hypothetical protein